MQTSYKAQLWSNKVGTFCTKQKIISNHTERLSLTPSVKNLELHFEESKKKISLRSQKGIFDLFGMVADYYNRIVLDEISRD